MKIIIFIIFLFQLVYSQDFLSRYIINDKIKIGNIHMYKGMYESIYHNNSEKLNKLLNKNLDLNVLLPIKLRYTPLYYAVKRGKISIVELLLKEGANINFISPANDEGKYATSAISAAIANNNILLTKFLLENNASINIDNSKVKSIICNKKEVVIPPLFYAYTKEMLDLLISNGGDIYQQNAYGETIIDWYVGATKLKPWLMKKYSLDKVYFKCSNKNNNIIKVVHTNIGFKEYDANGTIVYEYNNKR